MNSLRINPILYIGVYIYMIWDEFLNPRSDYFESMSSVNLIITLGGISAY